MPATEPVKRLPVSQVEAAYIGVAGVTCPLKMSPYKYSSSSSKLLMTNLECTRRKRVHRKQIHRKWATENES